MKISKRIANTMSVNWEGFKALQEKCCFERTGKPLSDSELNRMKTIFERNYKTGWNELHDGALGGCDSNRRWTSWTCEQMQKILDDAGIEYKAGNKKEVVDVAI